MEPKNNDTMVQIQNSNNQPILEIDHFLSAEECDALLAPRIKQFSEAISHYPKYYRNNNRLEEDNPSLAKKLFRKIQQEQIPVLKDMLRLNERLRFCQYQAGQQFTRHQDGVYYPNEKEASSLTFLLYLNDSSEFEGGETHFFHSKKSAEIVHAIQPQKGKLVIFDHRIWHSGNEVTSGTKYILRSDLIHANVSNKKQHKGYIWCLTKLQDNTFLSGGRDTVIRRWNKDLLLLKEYNFHSKSVIKILDLGNGEMLSCSRDLTIKKWNLEGQLLASITLKTMVLTMAKCGGNIVLGNTKGEVVILNQALEIKACHKIHDAWVWSLLQHDETLFSVAEDGTMRASSLASKVGTFKIDPTSSCSFSVISKESIFALARYKNELLLGTKTGKLLRYNLIDGSLTAKQVHQDIIRSIKIVGDAIITCGEDNRIFVSNNSGKKLVGEHKNFVQDIIYLDGKIISAGFDGTLKKWEFSFTN